MRCQPRGKWMFHGILGIFLVTWMIILHQAPLSSKLLGQFGRVSPKHLISSLRFRRNHESGEDTWGHIGVNGKSFKLAMTIVRSDPTMTLLPQGGRAAQKDQFPTDKMNPFRELGVPKFAIFLRHTRLFQASLTCPHLPQLTCCAWPGTAAGKLFSVPWQELQKGQMSWTIWQVRFSCDKFWCNFWTHRAHI